MRSSNPVPNLSVTQKQDAEFNSFKDKHRTYRAYGGNLTAWSNRDEFALLEGPARTGKTRLLLEKAHYLCQEYPRSRILFTRKTRESMTHSILQTFEDHVVPPGHECLAGPYRNIRQEYRYPSGSSIVVCGMDKPAKIMSTEYDAIFTFESTELTEEDAEMLITRLSGTAMPYCQWMADCNPGNPNHWLNRRANKGDIVRIKTRLQDNPVFYDHDRKCWTMKGIAYRRKLETLTGARYLRLVKGLWAAAEGLIFPDFDHETHVRPRRSIPQSWERIVGFDFGYTHPFVCQWWAFDEDRRAYLYRQLHMSGRTVNKHIETLKFWFAQEKISAFVADHDAEDRATLEEAGIRTIPAYKDVSRGIQNMQERMVVQADKRPRFFVLRDSLIERDLVRSENGLPCEFLDEIDGYVWAKTRDGVSKEEPVKENDDGMDCARYVLAYADNLAGMTIDVVMEEPLIVDLSPSIVY